MRPRGERLLIWFWAVLLSGAGLIIATLAVLGPPPGPPTRAAPQAATHGPPAQFAAAGPVLPVRKPGSAIPGPRQALLIASPGYPGTFLPRIGADGAMPMHAYAAGWDPGERRPRVAILLAGIGASEIDSTEAITSLPGAVSLAISPYGTGGDRLLDAARARGHALLVSIPMEPQGYPLNDAGDRALLTTASARTNRNQLEWALTRLAGYVGATGALDGMRGERFAAIPELIQPILDELGRSGLFYIDPRPNAPAVPGTAPGMVIRPVDIVLDEPAVRSEIDARLERLERLARARGAAIGLAGRPLPVVVERIAAWASGLPAKGLALTPVSVVAQMPAAAAQAGKPATQ
jgi:uncharacterized protein